jgi:hypothetical protein
MSRLAGAGGFGYAACTVFALHHLHHVHHHLPNGPAGLHV